MIRLHKYILSFLINKKKGFDLFRFLLKSPLILLSLLVALFSKIKRTLYSRSFIFKAKDPGIFIISVGNINMGGSGKTPFSYAIAEYLYGLDLKPCIVSRGYKGRLKKNSI
jgi:tetraacyldisaccharide 4'-kinase